MTQATTVLPTTRSVQRTVRGIPTSDGAGVKLTRVLGTSELRRVDPFLMLDEFRSDEPSDYLAGFPNHPHRGFETFTYMLAGKFRHRDNHGGEGLLDAGGGQWMTAGRGIVHSEMPEQEEGLVWGFQLWINLPAAEKMRAPGYLDVKAQDIPRVKLDGGAEVRVVAGRIGDVVGPIPARTTEPVFFDVSVSDGGASSVPLPPKHAAFLYVFDGELLVGDAGRERKVSRGELAVLGEGEQVRVASSGKAGRAILVAGKPIGEPIVQYGPFVMNKPEELEQAVRDFQAGRF